MKRLTLILIALLTSLLLSACSISEMAEEFINNLDSDAISNWLLEMTEVELDQVKSAQEIKDSLPDGLSDLTVDGTALGCQVTHLAIRNRDTDTTRRTDQVECEVILEGDGIEARFVCTLYYTYTANGSWGLTDWSLDSSGLDLEITQGALTDQLEQACVEELEADLGEGGVTYQATEWDKTNLVCNMTMLVNAESNYLLTQGYIIVKAKLIPNLSSGLSFTWDISQDTSNLLYGVDAEGTTWLVSGYVDTTGVQVALSFSDMDIEEKTITVAAVTSILNSGATSYTTRTMENSTVTYTVGKNNMITVSFSLGGHSWDCCFDADAQWVRMDGSYVSAMTRQTTYVDTLSELTELASENAVIEDDYAMDYANTTGGYTYTASDGTLVYEMQVEYPKFSGSGSTIVNATIQSVVKSFLGSPQLSTTTEDLDALAEQAAEGTVTLSCYDKLVISVEYNRNHYLSLLLTYTQRLTDGKVTYTYDSITYDMNSVSQLSDSDLYSNSSGLGKVLNSYASTARYSDAMVTSCIRACTLSQSGLVFYVVKSESSGLCETITIPYTEGAALVNPEG